MSRIRLARGNRFQQITAARWWWFAAVLASASLTAHGAALAQAVDGFWTVQGRAVSGTRCSDWLVRLAVEQGRLTGVVGVGQGNVMLQKSRTAAGWKLLWKYSRGAHQRPIGARL
jgi:hypothetical protein